LSVAILARAFKARTAGARLALGNSSAMRRAKKRPATEAEALAPDGETPPMKKARAMKTAAPKVAPGWETPPMKKARAMKTAAPKASAMKGPEKAAKVKKDPKKSGADAKKTAAAVKDPKKSGADAKKTAAAMEDPDKNIFVRIAQDQVSKLSQGEQAQLKANLKEIAKRHRAIRIK
jgi:hypothetical protein